MRETFKNILLSHKFLSQKNSEYSFGILGISACRPYHSEGEKAWCFTYAIWDIQREVKNSFGRPQNRFLPVSREGEVKYFFVL